MGTTTEVQSIVRNHKIEKHHFGPQRPRESKEEVSSNLCLKARDCKGYFKQDELGGINLLRSSRSHWIITLSLKNFLAVQPHTFIY